MKSHLIDYIMNDVVFKSLSIVYCHLCQTDKKEPMEHYCNNMRVNEETVFCIRQTETG